MKAKKPVLFSVTLTKLLAESGTKVCLYKLQTVGITGSLLHGFTDYLINIKHRVALSDAFSQWSTFKALVPQGSILGSLLFLIYINDMLLNISSSIRLFAEFTSLYIMVENPVQLSIVLNSDISLKFLNFTSTVQLK